MLLALGVSAGLTQVGFSKNHAGDVINLFLWKLAIPLDDNGDGVADEVTMPTLRLFEDPDFFLLSPEKNTVLFRVRAGDPTTEDSEFPRSELQEMKKGGTDPIAWGTDDGKVHNMTLAMSVNELPAENPDIICARIFGEEDALLNVRVTGKKLFLERKGTDPVILTDNYEPGELFNLMLIADNGRIRALHEWKQVMEWKIVEDGLFFKAGCHLQTNPEKGEKPDAVGEVEIKSLFVTHK